MYAYDLDIAPETGAGYKLFGPIAPGTSEVLGHSAVIGVNCQQVEQTSIRSLRLLENTKCSYHLCSPGPFRWETPCSALNMMMRGPK